MNDFVALRNEIETHLARCDELAVTYIGDVRAHFALTGVLLRQLLRENQALHSQLRHADDGALEDPARAFLKLMKSE